MSLSHAQIRAAVDGIDAVAQIEVQPFLGGPYDSADWCVSVVFKNPGDLIALGMSLARECATSPAGGLGWESSVRAIGEATDDLPTMKLSWTEAGNFVAYWPAVPVDPEVGP